LRVPELHVILFVTLDPAFNVANKTPGNASYDSFLDEKIRILVSMNLLQTFRYHYIAHFLILNVPGLILDLCLLPITTFHCYHVTKTRNVQRIHYGRIRRLNEGVLVGAVANVDKYCDERMEHTMV
jgi:hypothetical protein